ncbi:ankyrin, partial [Colletotrichum caudatum]
DSALHYAAREGIVKMAQFLIGHQAENDMRAANINLQNEFGETALHLAVRSGEVEMVHLLLRHGANTSIQNERGDAAIHVALGELGCPTVQLLLKYDADLHLRNHAGDMAVHIASRVENDSILESLVQQGGDVHAKDKRGMRPIHHRTAKRLGVRTLVRLGADVRAQIFDGKTALHMFIEVGSCNQDSFSALGHPQDLVFIKDFNGMTALHYAAQKSSAVMVRRLLLLVPEQNKRLGLLSTQDRFGQTALHSAAKRNTLEIFRILFEAGANLELRDRDG